MEFTVSYIVKHADVRSHQLAENIEIRTDENGWLHIRFNFLCHRCGRRHWAEEIAPKKISTVGWLLPCGKISIRFPWTPTPSEEPKSVYEQIKPRAAEKTAGGAQ